MKRGWFEGSNSICIVRAYKGGWSVSPVDSPHKLPYTTVPSRSLSLLFLSPPT